MSYNKVKKEAKAVSLLKMKPSLLKDQLQHFQLNKMDLFSQMKKIKKVKEHPAKKVQNQEDLQLFLRTDLKKKEINIECKEKKR